jgi:hypothetical protein
VPDAADDAEGAHVALTSSRELSNWLGTACHDPVSGFSIIRNGVAAPATVAWGTWKATRVPRPSADASTLIFTVGTRTDMALGTVRPESRVTGAVSAAVDTNT